MSNEKPASMKVLGYVTSLLNRTDCTILPSIREIAHHCSVSPSTVWKVISKLQGEGQLEARWGHEVRVKGTDVSIKQDVYHQHLAKWERIREAFKIEYLSGRFQGGTLIPSIKELQKKYNASFVTIKKVLSTFIVSGKIESAGASSYRISGSHYSRRWRPVVVVICAGSHPGIPKILTEREREFYQSLTIGITDAQLDLRYLVYNDWEGEPVFYPVDRPACDRPADDDTVIGYIVSSWHFKSIDECLFRLSHIRKPVSIWIESAITSDIVEAGYKRAFFNIGYSANTGKNMAEHLLRLGHKEIAYVSPFHKSIWSQERLSGLIDVFTEQGPGHTIHPFTLSKSDSEWDYTNEIAERSDLDTLFNVQAISEETSSQLNSRLLRYKNEGIMLLRDSLILKSIQMFIDRIIQNSAITAIVCVNDHCALIVMDYLTGRGIKIPSRLSLSGFDNSFEALVNGLTSYSFDTHTMVHAMIENITGMAGINRAERVQFFDGRVIERATTGVVKRN